MYVHNQNWDVALRVAEQYDPSSIPEILVGQAMSLAERKQYSLAEALYLKAKRPELALKMYREVQAWPDALRMAESYVPARVNDIKTEMATYNNKGRMATAGGVSNPTSTIATMVSQAKAYERGNDFARAIETYLQITTSDCNDHDTLEQCWGEAANLAINYQRHRMNEVVREVVQRLVEIERYEAAGTLLKGVDDYQGAIQMYCLGALWDHAHMLAGKNLALKKYVDEQYTSYLVYNKNADELATRGNAGQAIAVYAQQGDWDKVYELAAQQGPEQVRSYAAKHARMKFKQREFAEAALVLAKHGVQPDPNEFDLYRGIALHVLGFNHKERNEDAERAVRDFLHELVVLLEEGGVGTKSDLEDFNKLFWSSHYLYMSSRCQAAGLMELAAKQATALLRYIGIIPADKAFFLAGTCWKEAGMVNMAFVFSNRFLDLCDAMDDPDGGAAEMENSDFVTTDIPFDFHLPQKPFADEDSREEMRSFVLEVSMDQQVEQSLSCRTCEHCGVQTYEANLQCHKCKRRWEQCAISGYPVLPGERLVSKTNPKVVMQQASWNVWVSKFGVDPITGTPATPTY